MGDMAKDADTRKSGNDGGMEPERTFTQEEVNRIVGERLARARQTPEDDGLAAREEEIQRRELAIQAQEMLMKKGLPKDLADILHFTDGKSLEDVIGKLEQHIDAINGDRAQRFVPLEGGRLPKGVEPPKKDPTRRAFGLE